MIHYEHMIQRFSKLSKSQSFFLFGPRGCGKSTLLKSHFEGESCLWVDLLNQKYELELSLNPDLLLEMWKIKKNKWIVIDEVQKIPKLLDVVHRGIEESKIKFALTGSSSRKIKRGSGNLLAGRAASFQLQTFSALELGAQFQLEKALKYGLLPQYWSDDKMSNQDISRSLYSYIQTYLKEEIAAEQLVRNLDPFRRFLVSASQSNAKIVNFSKIERDAGIAHTQAERHFEILTDTYLGHFLQPYDLAIRKRQFKKSKFYFFDTGVVRTLQNLTDEELYASTFEFGDLFETFIINEFFKLKNFFEKKWEFSYFRSNRDVEIDLIIEKPRGKPLLIEIKSSDKVSIEDVDRFLSIAKDIEHSEAYLISRSKTNREINGIKCLYWKDALEEIFGDSF